MPPFPVPKSPSVNHVTVVGPSRSTTDSTPSRGSAECHATGYDLASEYETASNTSSEPPSEAGDDVAVDLENPTNNYRKGERVNDFKNKHGIVCYKNKRQTQLVRCANKLVTLENMNPIFLNPTAGVIHYNKSLKDFFDFVVHTSGQGNRNWGTSLNLKIPDHLRLIKEDLRILNDVASLRRELGSLGGEETMQSNFLKLVFGIFFKAVWLTGSMKHQIKSVSGGHVAYAPSENDVNRTYPAAIGTFIDTILRSLSGKRCVVFESKKPGEIDSATSKSALIQALTGALGERADIAIISTGVEFGIYWFERTGGVTRIYKVLDVHDLIDASEDDEKLIEIAAHIAFFLADVPPQQSKEGEEEEVNTQDHANTGNNAVGREPAPKKPRTTQEGNRDVRDHEGQRDGINDAPNNRLKASSDVWEAEKIEGPGKIAICFVLRADLNQETRLAIMKELKQESDDEY